MTLEQLENQKQDLQDKVDKLILESIIEKAEADNVDILIDSYSSAYEELFFIKYIMKNSAIFAKYLQDACMFYPTGLVIAFKDEMTADVEALTGMIDSVTAIDYKQAFFKLCKDWRDYSVSIAKMSIITRLKCWLLKDYSLSLDSILLQRLSQCSKSMTMMKYYEDCKQELLAIRAEIEKKLPLCLFPATVANLHLVDYISQSQLRFHPELASESRRLVVERLLAEIDSIKAQQELIKKALGNTHV